MTLVGSARGDRAHPGRGIEDGPADGRTMELIDPSSNRLRFFERPVTA